MNLRSVSIAAAVVTLIAGAAGSPPSATAQDLPTYLGQYGYVGVPLTKLPTGHETVSVTINGVEGRFVLDSGAGGTVVHSASLDKFSLEVPEGEGVRSSGAGGEITLHRVPVASFQIDDLILDIDEIHALDLSAVVALLSVAAESDIDGVIGQDVLTRFEGVLDARSQTLFLRPSAAAAADPSPIRP
ncbi:MAG: putative aspartyl protease [Brevundimonas sp.]|jgi:predicted aspartyl protease|uniref:retropepsin-like aspartic protease n=1 Tax=Brevundimonas sp. TaxID=1871086 RepID=UPI0039E381EC